MQIRKSISGRVFQQNRPITDADKKWNHAKGDTALHRMRSWEAG